MSETATTTIPGLVAGTYALDVAHTEIGFTVRHLMTKVRGTFEDFSGEIVVKDSLEESTANVTVELASVHTRNEQRDGHLRSGDFFDAENSPKMTFTSTGARQPEGDDYILAGELTIKDVTKPIEFGSRVPRRRAERVRPGHHRLRGLRARSAARTGASTSTCRWRVASC